MPLYKTYNNYYGVSPRGAAWPNAYLNGTNLYPRGGLADACVDQLSPGILMPQS